MHGCDIVLPCRDVRYLSRILEGNVVIQYVQTGLGYAGRPGGPAPTITLAVEDMPFQFFFLGGVVGFAKMRMPPTTSITAEIASGAPSF